MGLDRQNLTVNPKAANSMLSAESQRGKQRLRVAEADTRQFQSPIGIGQFHQASRSSCAKSDGLLDELAAKAQTQVGAVS
jgi:hypothetical protein